MPRPRVHVLLVLSALLLAGCSAPAGSQKSSVSFGDVHGLAVDPEDPDVVFVATHRGLFRLGPGGFERVGASQDDLMGFALHPRDARVAWSSGHPGPGTEGGPNLGVRQSTDGGRTWEPLALPGVDFHAMAVSPANPDRLWGHARGELHRSVDGGRTWEGVSEEMERVTGIAPSPKNADFLFAATGQAVMRSNDGGRTWQAVKTDAPRALGLALPPEGTPLYVATGSGLAKTPDYGGMWFPAGLEVATNDLAFVAVSPSRPATLYAATYGGAVHRSLDAGATWTEVKGPG